MVIRSIDLSNFRNYEELHLDLSDGIHILFGDNAQGKTNILESIYLSATNKSHRQSKDRDMIRFGCEEGHIKVIAEKNGLDYRIDLHLRSGKNKGIAVNGVPVRKAGDFMGILNCVLFSPEDLQIVKEGPQERRRFLDMELCMIDKIYLNASVQYKKALEQRNQLLKDISFDASLKDTLDVWDEQLVRFGSDIIRRRESFIRELGELVLPIHRDLTGEKEELFLDYEKDVPEADLRRVLREARERDLRAKTTTVGPHRDDMSFLIRSKDREEKMDARIFGSQGQQRTCALSLKMAEIGLVKRVTGDTPVFLLDDVLSELDGGRREFLLQRIKGIQTIITCTGLDDFINNQFQVNHVYQVINGKVNSYGKHERI